MMMEKKVFMEKSWNKKRMKVRCQNLLETCFHVPNISDFMKKIREKWYITNNMKMHPITPVYLIQPYYMSILSSSSLQLIMVIIVHAELYLIRLTSPFALGYKQTEHGNILF